jgi:hypothetical protein
MSVWAAARPAEPAPTITTSTSPLAARAIAGAATLADAAARKPRRLMLGVI